MIDLKQLSVFILLNLSVIMLASSQCQIKEQSIEDFRFKCQSSNLKEIQSLWNEFCTDKKSDFHLVYQLLPNTVFYSMILDGGLVRITSDVGYIDLSGEGETKVVNYIKSLATGKVFVTKCDDETRFSDRYVEMLALKKNGKVVFYYEGGDKNNIPMEYIEDKRLKPIQEFIAFLDEKKGSR